MKNFEKFQSKALRGDALKQIKGGTSSSGCHEVSPYCASVFLNCAHVCYTGDFTDWYDCVTNQSGTSGPCSPPQGWDNVCYYTDCY